MVLWVVDKAHLGFNFSNQSQTTFPPNGVYKKRKKQLENPNLRLTTSNRTESISVSIKKTMVGRFSHTNKHRSWTVREVFKLSAVPIQKDHDDWPENGGRDLPHCIVVSLVPWPRWGLPSPTSSSESSTSWRSCLSPGFWHDASIA